MKQAFIFAQIAVSVILTALILIQARGTGLGRSAASSSSFSRRGLEKMIFRLSIIFSVIFLLISILRLVL